MFLMRIPWGLQLVYLLYLKSYGEKTEQYNFLRFSDFYFNIPLQGNSLIISPHFKTVLIFYLMRNVSFSLTRETSTQVSRICRLITACTSCPGCRKQLCSGHCKRNGTTYCTKAKTNKGTPMTQPSMSPCQKYYIEIRTICISFVTFVYFQNHSSPLILKWS